MCARGGGRDLTAPRFFPTPHYFVILNGPAPSLRPRPRLFHAVSAHHRRRSAADFAPHGSSVRCSDAQWALSSQIVVAPCSVFLLVLWFLLEQKSVQNNASSMLDQIKYALRQKKTGGFLRRSPLCTNLKEGTLSTISFPMSFLFELFE